MPTRVISLRIEDEELASLILYLTRYGCSLRGLSNAVRQSVKIFIRLAVDEDIKPENLSHEQVLQALSFSESEGSAIMKAVQEIQEGARMSTSTPPAKNSASSLSNMSIEEKKKWVENKMSELEKEERD